MAVTVTLRANSTALTTREKVKRLLEIEDTTDQDALLDELIVAASAAVVAYCHRPFARETVQETVRGYGGTMLMLARTPIAVISSLLASGQDPITDYVVESAEAGLLYRKRGWLDTAQLGWTIVDYRVPGSEDPLYVASYSAGYLLPGDDVEADETLSVDGPSRQFRLTAGTSFPLTLVGGDRVLVEGFANDANKGWFTVQAPVTAQALTVAEALVTEPVGEGIRTVTVATLPADVELAARETVRSMFIERKRNEAVASKAVGDLHITYRDTGTASATVEGVPVGVCGRLAPWRRVA